MGCTFLAYGFNFKFQTAAGSSEVDNEHKPTAPKKKQPWVTKKTKCKCETLMGCVLLLNIFQFEGNI